jgi:UDP-2,3-diacylglucosamine pyrophosphatase LpxH
VANASEDLVIISDLHLGPGPGECVETFYNDDAFAAFIDHLRHRADEEGRRSRLVILGDFVDILRAELVTNPTGDPMSEPIALATLDQIIEGHPKVFDALGVSSVPAFRSTSSSATTTSSW